MNECFGKRYILNGEFHPVETFDKSLVYEGDSLYEVLRIMKGCPVFFVNHMDRLISSAKLQRKKILADVSTLRRLIIDLVRMERKSDINVKIVFNYKNSETNFLIYCIESVYPTQIQYQKGVKGILYSAERKDPESKVINHRLRSLIYHQLIHESAYEAILVNEKDQITEGSRSNIFFVKNDRLITAPDNIILNGITRKYVIEICKENKIDVSFECVLASKIIDYDAAFMTGTSPMVLPFSQINNVSFNIKLPVIETLRKLYLDKAQASILEFGASYRESIKPTEK
jgi:branched-chain amino acid aminotransferase